MADRYSFQSPFARGHGSDPWFTVGSVAVTTTVAITALAFFGLLLWVVEGGYGPIGSLLLLDDSAVTGGQVWRFVTYLIPPAAGVFWALLGMMFFFMIGSQMENMMGRRSFTAMVVALTVIPAILGAIVAIGTGGLPSFGLSMMFLGIAAGFSAAMPQARSFFGIPFWGLVAFIFFVQVLSMLAARSLPGLVMLFTTGAIGLIMTKSLGFSNVEWIPSMAMPGAVTGQSSSPAPRKAKRGRGRKGGAILRSVPPPTTASEAEIDALLDQVSENGMDSLTKQQRRTLEQHAKEMRKRRDS